MLGCGAGGAEEVFPSGCRMVDGSGWWPVSRPRRQAPTVGSCRPAQRPPAAAAGSLPRRCSPGTGRSSARSGCGCSPSPCGAAAEPPTARDSTVLSTGTSQHTRPANTLPTPPKTAPVLGLVNSRIPAQRILRARPNGQELLCDLWACVWGFCWISCGAGSIRLAAGVRPGLLALCLPLKCSVAAPREKVDKQQAAQCSGGHCHQLQAGLDVGSLQDAPFHWLTRTAPAGRALPASPLLLAGVLGLHFNRKSKAASSSCPACRDSPGVHPWAALPLALRSRPLPCISLMELERQAASVPGEEGQLGVQCSLSSPLCRFK